MGKRKNRELGWGEKRRRGKKKKKEKKKKKQGGPIDYWRGV
jgi:hypothetical protein